MKLSLLRSKLHRNRLRLADGELDPWYDRAEARLGVTGTHGIPRLPVSNHFKVLWNGATRIGYRHVDNDRHAINSRPRDGRPACLQLGFCTSGCKSMAKWSGRHIRMRMCRFVCGMVVQASATGDCHLYCAVVVKQVDAKTRAKTSINDLLRA